MQSSVGYYGNFAGMSATGRNSDDRERPVMHRLLAPTTDVDGYTLPYTRVANVKARELTLPRQPPPLSRSVQLAVGENDDSEDAGYGCAWNVADLQSQVTGLRYGDLLLDSHPVTCHSTTLNAKGKYVRLVSPLLPLPPPPSQPPPPPPPPPPPSPRSHPKSIIDTAIPLEDQK